MSNNSNFSRFAKAIIPSSFHPALGRVRLKFAPRSTPRFRTWRYTQPSLQASDTETVKIVTIDETIPRDRKISVLHLDVEGYEEQALTGALKTIRRSRPLLVLEDVPSEAWLTKHLKPLGYRIDRRIHHNTLLCAAAIV